MALELGKKINGGGTGAIHEGPDDTIYKITNGSKMANEDLLREFYMLDKLQNNTDIPTQQMVDAGRDDDRLYIQMKRIHGEGLDEMLHYGRLTHQDLLEIQEQIADIYDELAEAGYYHGDAGATCNYMITRTDQGLKVHIVDFAEGGEDKTGQTARQEAAQIDKVLQGLIRSHAPDMDGSAFSYT